MGPYDPYAHHAAYIAAGAPGNDWGRFSDPTPMHGTMSPPRRLHPGREPHPGMYGSLPDSAMGYPPMMEVRPCLFFLVCLS
jgi:hypothetical protein